jgi:hypothetical protein
MKTTTPPASRLIPTGHKVCTGRELAAALVDTRLSKEEAKAWSARPPKRAAPTQATSGQMAVAPAAVVIIRGERGTFNPQGWLQAQGFANVKGLKVIEPK